MKESVKQRLLNSYFEGDNIDGLSYRDRNAIDCFLKSYEPNKLDDLNERQLMVLYHLFLRQDTDTDWLASSLSISRRAAVNTANALVRRQLLHWDVPTGSNVDRGYDLMLNRKAMLSDEFLSQL